MEKSFSEVEKSSGWQDAKTPEREKVLWRLEKGIKAKNKRAGQRKGMERKRRMGEDCEGRENGHQEKSLEQMEGIERGSE